MTPEIDKIQVIRGINEDNQQSYKNLRGSDI